mmetsp:Transcript_841/g.2459  ORF Transcript_841/g.2459 Transcript_841/m.2459 type:complete len:117 (-) Transcript_841:221-571(-)
MGRSPYARALANLDFVLAPFAEYEDELSKVPREEAVEQAAEKKAEENPRGKRRRTVRFAVEVEEIDGFSIASSTTQLQKRPRRDDTFSTLLLASKFVGETAIEKAIAPFPRAMIAV